MVLHATDLIDARVVLTFEDGFDRIFLQLAFEVFVTEILSQFYPAIIWSYLSRHLAHRWSNQ